MASLRTKTMTETKTRLRLGLRLRLREVLANVGLTVSSELALEKTRARVAAAQGGRE